MIQKTYTYPVDYTASLPRRQHYSQSQPLTSGPALSFSGFLICCNL